MARTLRGFSLLEMVTAAVIFSLASLSVFLLFSRGSKFFRHNTGRQDLQRQALVCLQQIHRQFRHSSSASLSLHYLASQQMALGMASPLDPEGRFQVDTATARPSFVSHWVFFLRGSSRTLEQVRRPLPLPTTDPLALTPAELTAATSLPTHILARDVSVFRALNYSLVAPTTAATTSHPLRLEIQIGGQTAELTLSCPL